MGHGGRLSARSIINIPEWNSDFRPPIRPNWPILSPLWETRAVIMAIMAPGPVGDLQAKCTRMQI